jgi:hypothetical protein
LSTPWAGGCTTKGRSRRLDAQVVADYKQLLAHKLYELHVYPRSLFEYRGQAEVTYLERIMQEGWLYSDTLVQ